jgi:hypothetical protein
MSIDTYLTREYHRTGVAECHRTIESGVVIHLERRVNSYAAARELLEVQFKDGLVIVEDCGGALNLVELRLGQSNSGAF